MDEYKDLEKDKVFAKRLLKKHGDISLEELIHKIENDQFELLEQYKGRG